MEVPTTSNAQIVPFVPFPLTAIVIVSAAVALLAFPLVSTTTGVFVDLVHRHKVMAATICSAIPLIAAYFKSSKSNTPNMLAGSGGSSRESMTGERKPESEKKRTSVGSSTSDTLATNTSLVRKHSFTIPVTTDDFSYPSIRVFHREHSKAQKLGRSLPLLVFIHGLGGQLAQYQFMLEYFVHISHTLAIDLPGCGGSEFGPSDWKAYTTESLCKLISVIVQQHLQEGQKIVLIGHSMGCGLAATLATRGGLLHDACVGLVAICPKADMSDRERSKLSTALKLGNIGFDIFRLIDRWGGIDSKSVTRFVGKQASLNVKEMQLTFNKQSRTPVWRRMAKGLTLPTRAQWADIDCPVYLLAGSEDAVTPPSELEKIYHWLTERHSEGQRIEEGMAPKQAVIKRCVIPGAGHSVIYESQHVVNGLVNDFLSHHVDEVLNLAWQLNVLKEDKWMLKNMEKWMKIQSVSPRVGKSQLRAMKTLRQNDEEHSPTFFSEKYPDIAHVIDISHEQPPYDPETFGPNVEYHKFATVSKIPPTADEVARFIALVDELHTKLPEPKGQYSIACHCHYGFNRTGFFLCCYLIERLGYDVADALDEFKKARAPGIRHPHFITELFERYACPGLRRPSIS
ncbi:Alpha/Beta hydrolase protein [Kalaharituber pfeilii]|nr:Alpha/Beta hydrolase protein [Kalaharituber pfeilii]